MAFWNQSSLDPKRQFKFKVSFPFLNFGSGNDSTFLAQSADRPNYKISDGTKIHYLDKEFKFPGKITWDPVKITFVDVVSADNTNVSKNVYDYLTTAGYVAPPGAGPQVGANNMKTISKSKSVPGTGDVTIEVLSSEGLAVDIWTLKNAFITSATLNGLDYKAEDVLTAQFSFTYDWADFQAPLR